MIVRITRLLLLVQAIFALATGWLAIKVWHVDNIVLAVLIGLLVVLLFRMTLTVNNFAMAWRHRSPLPDGAALGYTGTLRLVLGEFRATMWSSSWTMPFRRFDRYVATYPTGLPVLLVHGYGCNSGYWHSMSKALAKAGITHHAIDMEPVFGSIDDYADVVHRSVEALCRETGHARIVIVAHSMGGLAARAYLRDHGSEQIAKVITLGTPHHGTALARHAVGINTEQMCWTPEGEAGESSAWLQRLHAGETDATRALLVSIYSHHDNIISPQTSSHLSGARNVELSGIGHVELALHPKVQAIVIDEILAATQVSDTAGAAQVDA